MSKADYKADSVNCTTEAASLQNVAQECPSSINLDGNVCRPLVSKICKGCKDVLPLTKEFYYYNKIKESWFAECKECNKDRSAKWNKENPEQYKANCKRHQQENPELYTEYKRAEYERNKESYAEYQKVYRKTPNGKATREALNRERELAKIQATPAWLTQAQREEMKTIYANRPEGYHVDHIVPIKGKNVCGLHVPWNLQYLLATENSRKYNKF